MPSLLLAILPSWHPLARRHSGLPRRCHVGPQVGPTSRNALCAGANCCTLRLDPLRSPTGVYVGHAGARRGLRLVGHRVAAEGLQAPHSESHHERQHAAFEQQFHERFLR